jgi:hypothetical protein
MAKLPSFKRLNKGDFEPQYHGLMEKIILSLNTIVDSVLDAMNRKISLKNNILCSVRDITVVVDSSGVPTSPVNVTYDFVGAASVVVVGRVVNLTNVSGYPSSGVGVYWEQVANNGIRIRHVSGILPSNSHSLRLVIYGDEA